MGFDDVYRELFEEARQTAVKTNLMPEERIFDMGAGINADRANINRLSMRSPEVNGFLIVTNFRLFHQNDLGEIHFELVHNEIRHVIRRFYFSRGNSIAYIVRASKLPPRSFYCSTRFVKELMMFYGPNGPSRSYSQT